ncbi:excisionase family DNA-binding protein [Streptomyces sp. NPDC127051]|uniref:excisionase family DNA-binding protein n=1 Tax=Streptomyces sp. NPDC127051 TaxID=3347119 RepID=UPI0036550ECF
MNHAEARGSSSMDSRPAPIVLWDGVAVPGILCEELAAAIELLSALVRGVPLPVSRRATRLSPAVVAIGMAARAAAVRNRQSLETTSASGAVASPGEIRVLASAKAGASSGLEITTSEAAVLLGVTESRVRQLAAAGTIRGRKASRDTWLLSASDVRTYRARRTRSRRGSQDRFSPGGSPGPREGDRDSAAGAALSA